MQSLFLVYKSSLIHYLKSGNGSRLLVALHGYSDSCETFNLLEESIAADFTLISIDLPFHGKTEWKEGLIFTPDQLMEIIMNISHRESKIYLLGFSMGGRVALGLLQNMPAKIEKVILLAPDGLYVNKWYWLATQNKPGNALFYLTMKYPGWLFGLLHLGNKIKLIDQNSYKFNLSHLKDKRVREELYSRWTTMRSFNCDLKKIKSLIISNKIHVKLIYGEYDHIIRASSGEKFREGIESLCELHMLSCGHNILQEKNLEVIVGMIRE